MSCDYVGWYSVLDIISEVIRITLLEVRTQFSFLVCLYVAEEGRGNGRVEKTAQRGA
jgi:hypothetical protein